MPESDLAERLDAVERALTNDDVDLTDVRDRAALSSEVDRLESRITELEATVDELDAAVEAVRGYAGNVRAVNREVERRASAALAKAETLETAVDGVESASTDSNGIDNDVSTGTVDAGGTETNDAGDRQIPTVGRTTVSNAPGRQTAPEACEPAGQTDQRGDGPDPSGRGCQSGAAGNSSTTGKGSTTETDGPTVGNTGSAPGNGGRASATGPARPKQHSSARGSGSEQPTAEASPTDDTSSQTEQFIERVRDAL